MSGLDPLAALGAEAVAAAQAAMDEAALNLGVSSEVLQAQISVGDVIAATVLPPQGGSDLLSVLGQTVTAQLPTGVYPGETLALQVMSFGTTTVVVRNLGAMDPQNPPPVVDVQLPPQSEGVPQTAILRTLPPGQQPQSPPSATSAQPPATGVAPPREVFVAASVRPSQPIDLEARIAVTRAAGGAVPAPVRQAVPPAQGLPSQSIPAQRVSAPVQVLALLARSRIPATPMTLAAAKIADNAAQVLPKAYARLDALLARITSSDPRIASLRTLLSFTGKIDLANPRALPEQISAFVSHVLDGAEGKIAAIVSEIATAEEPNDASPAAADQQQAASQPAPQAPIASTAAASSPVTVPQATPAHQLPVAIQARVAERSVALESDVKTLLLSLAQRPPAGASSAFVQAVNDAAVATTAVQMNALSAHTLDPNAITIALPATFYEGGRPAQLRISRDVPNKGRRFDADDFHISFVLDTQSLGTVAIDLQSVGRAVSINVKTERASFADRMRMTLGDLRARLETLRYRVASIGADVAPTRAAAAPAPAAPKTKPASNVDARA